MVFDAKGVAWNAPREPLGNGLCRTPDGEAKADAPGFGAGAKYERGDKQATTRSDTPESRYERLRQHATDNPKESGWCVFGDPDKDLKTAQIGSIIETRCVVFVPEIIKALSPSGGLAEAIGQIVNNTKFP